ncbi:MAG: cellulase family glycosylhydrolase [Paludibacter sp.]|nr:cellulase family glycosylhydrolase [Paludibacter sp.]
MMKRTLLLLIISISPFLLKAQSGYVHAAGKQIVDGDGNNLLIRSLGTGNWMVQEGYMMQSTDVALTQHAFRQRLIETIGADKTDQFYTTWLNNHFRKADIDSMARWGFNCVRPALHYNLFTLPIESEPVEGENTWLQDGFDRLDSLMSWCAANKMYVILDMHAAPGGQGTDQAISDYDPSKPSLWESELNKSKLVALWQKLAERYADNPWIAGYDLLNETNWTFSEGSNAPLKALLVRITNAIRQVDNNHMIIIEGNWFANDFSGLTPKWDSNMAYSFHKYWATNEDSSIDWMTTFRNTNNCPVWLGEAGENSNRWFTDCIRLMEKNNIGWSFWPVKKSGVNNVMRVVTNEDYTNLLNYWKGTTSKPSVDAAFNAVMTFAENHKAENCIVQRDVIDAMFRQVTTDETIPFKYNTTDSTIFTTDYDLGVAGAAYYDTEDADYHVSTNTYTAWNNGYAYRNDGVDIESGCSDAVTNGYSVGWIEGGEWTQYTVYSESEKSYTILLRYATASSAQMHIEINGRRVSKTVTLSSTGGWTSWRSLAISNVIVPAGACKIRLVFDSGTVNTNYFQFKNPKSVDATSFDMIYAYTDAWENTVFVDLNKEVTDVTGNPFRILIDDKEAQIQSTKIYSQDSLLIRIDLVDNIFPDQTITVSNTSGNCVSGEQTLTPFTATAVENKVQSPLTHIPARIEAENFNENNGFGFETCEDTGGGTNTSYAAAGKYLDYQLFVDNAGEYKMNFRVAANTATPSLAILNYQQSNMIPLDTIKFSYTGGWQNWQNQSIRLHFDTGKQKIRLLALTDGFNLNWVDYSLLTAVENTSVSSFRIYPNPVTDRCQLVFKNSDKHFIQILDLQGKILQQTVCVGETLNLNLSKFTTALYLIKVWGTEGTSCQKLQKL